MGFEPPMNGPIQDADTLRASSIKFVDATNGKRLPHELPLLSSVPFGWRGIVVEWHRLKWKPMASFVEAFVRRFRRKWSIA